MIAVQRYMNQYRQYRGTRISAGSTEVHESVFAVQRYRNQFRQYRGARISTGSIEVQESVFAVQRYRNQCRQYSVGAGACRQDNEGYSIVLE